MATYRYRSNQVPAILARSYRTCTLRHERQLARWQRRPLPLGWKIMLTGHKNHTFWQISHKPIHTFLSINHKTPVPHVSARTGASVLCGSYRDRTDDLLGVNELLYQLS